MDFYPIYSPLALLRVEHEDVVLCLALGKQKPFLCHGCCPFAGLSAAELWSCRAGQALPGRSLWCSVTGRGSCGDNILSSAPSQMVLQKYAGGKAPSYS